MTGGRLGAAPFSDQTFRGLHGIGSPIMINRLNSPLFHPHSWRPLLAHEQCLFCRIAAGEIPAELVYDTPDVVAFRDINPQAPTHILIIPRKHVPSVSELEDGDAEVMGSLFRAAQELARKEEIEESGYRMVVNAGADAGQAVFHIHMHLLGGRGMAWPPG